MHYLRLLHVFSCLAHFFLTLTNIALSGYATDYLSVHLLKDILAASSFGNYKESCNKHLCVSFVWF